MVTVMCYSPTEDALLAAYESGLVEIWQKGAVVGCKQVYGLSVSRTGPFNVFVHVFLFCKYQH